MNVENFEQLGGITKQVRKDKSMTRKEATELSGISMSWIQKFENVKHRNFEPTLTTVNKYCKFLGIDLNININIEF